MKCFYHSADLDGHCSGAIVKYAMPEAELIGIDYGQEFPWHKIIDPTEPVWMVDFSLQPFSEMVKLNQMCNGNLRWIDHHKSAILDWEEHNRPFNPTNIDTAFAACELTWNTCFPDRKMPQSVYWLGRYDIWKHEDVVGSLDFQYGMRNYSTWPDKEMDFWIKIFNDFSFASLIRDQGASILAYEKQQNAKFCKAYAFVTDLDGLRCIAANRGMSNSLLFESVYDREKHDAMLMFAFKHGKWTVSLYSDKPDVDVSVICKARGGGGHKGASGFQCDILPFLEG